VTRAAAVLVLLAAALWFGVANPAAAAAQRTALEQRQLRDERRDLARRLLPLERSEAARARAVAALKAEPLPDGRAAPVLRRAVVATLADAPLAEARVSVRPGRGEVSASLTLAGQGGLEQVLRTLERLVRPGEGLVLSRVRLRAAPAGVALELEGRRPRL
jgi:hypothetical protein